MFSSALGRMWRGHRTEEQTLGPSPRRACPRGALIQAGLSQSRRAGYAAPCKAAWAQLGQTETRKEERAPSRHLPPPLHAPQWPERCIALGVPHAWHPPTVGSGPKHPHGLSAPGGQAGARALGNRAVSWASAPRPGAQALCRASAQRAQSQAGGQKARSWAWPGQRVHSASSWAKMRKRGLNGAWDGCGGG